MQTMRWFPNFKPLGKRLHRVELKNIHFFSSDAMDNATRFQTEAYQAIV